MSEKLAFVSDVHGQHQLFKNVCRIVFRDEEADRLVIVGDAINKNNGNLEVLKMIQALGERAIYLAGNHDITLAASLFETREEIKPLWQGYFKDIRNTAPFLIRGVKNFDELAERLKGEGLLDLLRAMQLYYEDEDIFAVHAGLKGESLSDTRAELDTYARCRDAEAEYRVLPDGLMSYDYSVASDSDKLVISGHSHLNMPLLDRVNQEQTRARIGSVNGRLPILVHKPGKGVKMLEAS